MKGFSHECVFVTAPGSKGNRQNNVEVAKLEFKTLWQIGVRETENTSNIVIHKLMNN
jgi:hypothetical protein